MGRNIAVTIISLTVLCSCSFIPKYKRPAMPVEKKFPDKGVYKNISFGNETNVSKIKWQDFIKDPKLKEVVKLALKNNRDLRLAILNVEQARALYGIKAAELYPSLYATSGIEKQRVPEDISFTKKAYTEKRYSVNFGLAEWEIDFFGKIRSFKKEALEEFLAAKENRRAAQIALITEVSRAYLRLCADIENLKIAEELLRTAEENFELVKSQYDAGVATEIDLNRARTEVESIKVDVVKLKQLINLDINTLNFLVGTHVDEKLLPKGLPEKNPFEEVKPGISSYVLLNRPDVMAAEHKLKASYARIGAARAAFFPSISLTSAIGTVSDELSNLFKGSARTWNLSLKGALPVFDPRIWAAYKLSKVQRKIVLTQYEKTIQNAFKEVMDRLTIKATIDEQIEAQKKLVRSLERTYELSLKRYKQGIDSYFSVLDAKRNLLQAKQALTNLIMSKYANRIALYAALGGGGD
ncbi:efflux transporter outer membrane subunit [Thermodesulfobacterium hydrogeniphilum]|uniref:efflux transporter outer membrane subunit n=1 Tax=Thermodesulfobacterium hydrogeniphilum TaxID=161156 RepID=UPI00056DDBAD|nr:efflux transporter outer membrane subunit [Thermodesulfobacterium hydrogeniphilum]